MAHQPEQKTEFSTHMALQEAFAAIYSGKRDIDWLTAVPKSSQLQNTALVLDDMGNGGLFALKKWMKTTKSSIAFCLLRWPWQRTAADKRAFKFVFGRFVRTKLEPELKRRLSEMLDISHPFDVRHLSMDANETADGWTTENLNDGLHHASKLQASNILYSHYNAASLLKQKRKHEAARKAHQDEREKKELRESHKVHQSELRELRGLQQIRRHATTDCFLAELEGRINDVKCICDARSRDRDGMPAVDESALRAVLQRMTERHSAVDLKQLSINNKEWIPQLTAMVELVRPEKRPRRDAAGEAHESIELELEEDAAEESHGSVELELELEEDAVEEVDGRRNRGSIPLALYSEQDMRDLRQSHDVERQTWEDRRNELERINEANNQELMRLRREVQQLRAQASLLAAPEFVPDPPTHAQPQPQPQHRSRPSQIVDEETKHDITDVPVGNGLMHGVYVAQPMVYSSHAQPHMPPESIVPMPIANSQYYPPHGHGQLQLQATQNMGMGVDMEHERLKQQRLVQEAEAVKDCLDADEDSKTDICWHFNEWDGDCYDPNCTWRHRYFVEDVYNEVGDELYKGIIKRYVFTQGRCMSDPRLLQENALTDAETADLQNLYGGQAIAAPSHSQPRDRRASVAPVYHAYHGQ